MELNIITIDGPAGSGKSTVAKLVAQKLQWKYLDTGAMYRGLTYALLKLAAGKKTQLNDEFITSAMENLNWDVKILSQENSSPKTVFILDNQDVPDADIRSKSVENNISKIADNSAIRQRCSEIQRRFAIAGKLVTEGRDQGSTVFPDAKVKFYLDASVEVRAERRMKDFHKRGERISFNDLVNKIKQRDENDKNRAIGALKIPEDAEIIDTTRMTIVQVVERIVGQM